MRQIKKLLATLGLALVLSPQARAITYGPWYAYDNYNRQMRAIADVEVPGNNQYFRAYGTLIDTCPNVQFASRHWGQAWRYLIALPPRLYTIVGSGWNYDPAVRQDTYFPDEIHGSNMPYGTEQVSTFYMRNPTSGYYYFNAYGSRYFSTAGADTQVSDNYRYLSTYTQDRNYWECEECPC